jgi:hypothetical protein
MKMNDKGIRLSPKHGINPAIPLCYFCNKEKGEIILAGKMKGDVEAPRNAVWDMRPCEECEGYMKMGVILISVKDGGVQGDNPYRTGGWCVVKDEVIERMCNSPAFVQRVVKMRMAFIEDRIWDGMGLPRGEMKGGEDT